MAGQHSTYRHLPARNIGADPASRPRVTGGVGYYILFYLEETVLIRTIAASDIVRTLSEPTAKSTDHYDDERETAANPDEGSSKGYDDAVETIEYGKDRESEA